MRILRQDTAALVVDIQERLFPAMWEKETLLKNCTVLLKGLSQLNVPLIVTQQYTKGLGNTVEEIKQATGRFEHIEKRDFSCCDEPSVIEKLESLQANNIIICGIESHVCVLQTAIDLKEKGYNPVVVMDCVSSRNAASIDIARERFRFEGIMMTSAEAILFELTRTSVSPDFRAISAIVK